MEEEKEEDNDDDDDDDIVLFSARGDPGFFLKFIHLSQGKKN